MKPIVYIIPVSSKTGKKLLRAVGMQYIDEGLDMWSNPLDISDTSIWVQYLITLNEMAKDGGNYMARIHPSMYKRGEFYFHVTHPITFLGEPFYVCATNVYKAFGVRVGDLYRYGFNDPEVVPSPSSQA